MTKCGRSLRLHCETRHQSDRVQIRPGKKARGQSARNVGLWAAAAGTKRQIRVRVRRAGTQKKGLPVERMAGISGHALSGQKKQRRTTACNGNRDVYSTTTRNTMRSRRNSNPKRQRTTATRHRLFMMRSGIGRAVSMGLTRPASCGHSIRVGTMSVLTIRTAASCWTTRLFRFFQKSANST